MQGHDTYGSCNNHHNVGIRGCSFVSWLPVPCAGPVLDRCSTVVIILLRSPSLHVHSLIISNVRIMAQEQSIDKLTAVWLLPLVAPIVAAGTGGNLCTVLPPASFTTTLIASYVLWGIGVPFAMSILVLYIHRLTIHKVLLIRFSNCSFLQTKSSLARFCRSVRLVKEEPVLFNSGL